MKLIHIAPASLLFIAACGGGGNDKQAIVDACVADGSSDQATCECMADAAEKNLDGKLFSMLADAARDGSEATEEIMGDLTPEQQTQFMSFAMQAAMTCGMGE
ncbi:hypothetical protein [Henriciella mobilis]|uniref:Lipoprotein n=1 Tax=Henriciella mobilis TaxID=2305467 RepID=A0A399RFN4_9PROT|nr:hypothetical protein [Henriciella mobilis]RIJ14380.1 hypothetical protein D1231_16585 [Henriciella mobilis]RIJ19792.1 hypothetical protein D1227_15455 [Henriciella mobilis]RIJ28419.1 hypothetical protein D1223_13615 [Henriciella mobilis]